MRPRFAPFASRFLTCLALVLLVSCGGGGSSDAPGTGTPPTIPPPPTAPTASFTAAATAPTNAPIAFDASTSSSSAGALQYVWDFGDGTRGGGAKIAHAYAAAGTRSVTLTVVDTAGVTGTATRSITVSAAAAATGTVVVHTAVVDLSGAALSGVTIARQGSASVLGTTDASGVAAVTLERGIPFALRLAKSGYAEQVMTVQLPAAASIDSRINAVMRPRDAAQMLTDAHVGGTLAGRGGATITLPADALVDSTGALVTGAVSIAMTPVDPTLKGGGGFPGSFDGVKADASITPLVSFGTVEFVLGSDEARLQLAPGKTATIELPMYATRRLDGTVAVAGDSIALWSLDETTGLWTQEGTGTVVDNATSPTGLGMRAVVSHFSWWNTDLGFDPYGPKPKCVYDDDIGLPEARDSFNNATMCNMLAEMERTLGGNASVGRTRALADTDPAVIAGYSRQATVPIAGGTIILVPANRNVVLSATALNGTWTGSVVVNGPIGRDEDVLIRMRPLAVSGPVAEAITFPVDITRSIQPASAAQFSFTGSATQTARFTIGAPGSQVLVSGTARILQGSTVIASRPFSTASSAMLVLAPPAPGNYILEVQTQQFAGVRIQGALIGGAQDETLALPSDVTRLLPAYTLYRASFDVASPAGAHFAAQAGSMDLRLLAPDGSVIWSKGRATGINLIDVSLPVAGRYTFTAYDSTGNENSLRLTAELSDWGPVSEGVIANSLSSPVLDLVADRNGKPVLGHVTNPLVGSRRTQVLQLRRFTGSTWEDLGGPITSELSCEPHSASIAFDSHNTPTIVYQSRTVADDYRVTASRLVNGVWTAIGPNAGVLPHASISGAGGLCVDRNQPRVTLDTADQPVVAYRDNSGNLWVQRFNGVAWGRLAAAATESFPASYNVADLGVDPSGTLWLAYPAANGGTTPPLRAARFDVASGTWQAAGPNGGVLPESNTNGWGSARLLFDAAGRPVIAGSIGVLDSTRTSSSTGTAVYRFDGTNWVSTGGYNLPNSLVQGGPVVGFAMLGNDALMSWQNQTRNVGVETIVQRNTAGGWSGLGSTPKGALATYAAHGLTPERAVYDSRLLVVNTDVYLAAAIASPQGPQLVLLKKLR